MGLLLDICIAAYRRKGLERLVSMSHPSLPGVRYIVSWQYAADAPDDIPQEILLRKDMSVFPTDTVGLGANREKALEKAEAPLVLLSDDDVSYTAEEIQSVIAAFQTYPNHDFLIFRYRSDKNPRSFPDYEFDFENQPKNFPFGGPTIAFRLSKVREKGVRFNPLFGVNSMFNHGEDTLFVYDMSKKGLKGRYIPANCCRHEDSSTGMRLLKEPEFIAAKGALLYSIFPISWPLRMLTHTLREAEGVKSRLQYMGNWLKGVKKFRQKSQSIS